MFLATIALVVSTGLAAGKIETGDLKPLPTGQFEKLHQLLKPRADESRWMEIDWYPGVWEGRQQAAREGKPLFLWAGSGGAPAAGC